MDRYVIRETTTRHDKGYPVNQVQQHQFPQTSDGIINSDVIYSNNLYGNEFVGVHYNNEVNAGFPNINTSGPNMQHGFFTVPMAPGPSTAPVACAPVVMHYASSNSSYIGGDGPRAQPFHPIPTSSVIGTEYQNQNLVAPERVQHKSFATPPPTRTISNVAQRDRAAAGRMFAPQTSSATASAFTPVAPNASRPNTGENQWKPNSWVTDKRAGAFSNVHKKTEPETQQIHGEAEIKVVSRADKIKALQKSGPRVFSGPVESVLKWHKSLQEIGVFIFYEIVAKCVNITPGEGCAKNLVVRDENGPAMQIVYYEIDFMLPKLSPPCTIRVVGRMVPGACRLQAFSVRPASGDDVASLPRRAAVADHHVLKLIKEHGKSVTQ